MNWNTHNYKGKTVEAHKITARGIGGVGRAGERVWLLRCDDGRHYAPSANQLAGDPLVGMYFLQHHDPQNWHAEVVDADTFEAEAEAIG